MERQPAILSRNTHRLLRITQGAGLLILLAFTSAPKPVAPRCDLHLLNEYVRRVTYERQRVDPGAPPAYFDRSLLAGTVAFSHLLERNDTLYHDNTRYAELVGTFLDEDTRNPAQVAQLIFERLYASAPHRVVQADAGLTGVCASATNRSYVVRLSRAPVSDNQARQQRRRYVR